VEERFYGRTLGRGRRLMLLALWMTAVTFFVMVARMPRSVHGTAVGPPVTRVCINGGNRSVTCYTAQPERMWVEEQLQADGAWLVIGVSMSDPPQLVGAGR
jgi:hypothetical protein